MGDAGCSHWRGLESHLGVAWHFGSQARNLNARCSTPLAWRAGWLHIISSESLGFGNLDHVRLTLGCCRPWFTWCSSTLHETTRGLDCAGSYWSSKLLWKTSEAVKREPMAVWLNLDALTQLRLAGNSTQGTTKRWWHFAEWCSPVYAGVLPMWPSGPGEDDLSPT